jgi:hypothetical protein
MSSDEDLSQTIATMAESIRAKDCMIARLENALKYQVKTTDMFQEWSAIWERETVCGKQRYQSFLRCFQTTVASIMIYIWKQYQLDITDMTSSRRLFLEVE